jgi:hypothetical protein
MITNWLITRCCTTTNIRLLHVEVAIRTAAQPETSTDKYTHGKEIIA